MAKTIMIQGTMSNAGKSLLAAAPGACALWFVASDADVGALQGLDSGASGCLL